MADTNYRRCTVCGHEWVLRDSKEPKRCPARPCRSLRWKTGEDRRKDNPGAPKAADKLAEITTVLLGLIPDKEREDRLGKFHEVVEKLAESKVGFGIDAEAFIANQRAMSESRRPELVVESEPPDIDDPNSEYWSEKLMVEFGPYLNKLKQDRKYNKQKTIKARYEYLCDKRDNESGS